jgi:hypothetical protein
MIGILSEKIIKTTKINKKIGVIKKYQTMMMFSRRK